MSIDHSREVCLMLYPVCPPVRERGREPADSVSFIHASIRTFRIFFIHFLILPRPHVILVEINRSMSDTAGSLATNMDYGERSSPPPLLFVVVIAVATV